MSKYVSVNPGGLVNNEWHKYTGPSWGASFRRDAVCGEKISGGVLSHRLKKRDIKCPYCFGERVRADLGADQVALLIETVDFFLAFRAQHETHTAQEIDHLRDTLAALLPTEGAS